MQLNQPTAATEGAIGCGSDLGSSSEDDQLVVASLRKMVKKELLDTLPQMIKPMMKEFILRMVKKELLDTLPQMIKPMMKEFILKKEIMLILLNALLQLTKPVMEDVFRTVVKEEVQAALTNSSFGGNWINTNVVDVPNERHLRLKFLDEEPDDVLTGKKIKGKGGTPMRVALVDAVTGNYVESGVESSAKVEILLLEVSENNNEQNWGQDFDSRIIKESDTSKPHFAKSYHVYLEKGIGELTDAKLAHDKNWKKSCTCQLGARAVNLNGVPVQEAWTKPFVISDSRAKLYEKHHPPSLDDDVWRLEGIGKNGAPYRRLKEIKVSTVKDFLMLLSIDPQRLRNTLGTGVGDDAWNAIVAHAQTCNDTTISVYHGSSECDMSVVFNVVGGLKGVIRGYNFVRIDELPEIEKNQAHELLCSAFDNQDAITFRDEMDLVEKLKLSYQASFSTTSEIIAHHDPTRPGTSSPSISRTIGSSSNSNDSSHGDSFWLATMLSCSPDGISLVDSILHSDYNMHDICSFLELDSETPVGGGDHQSHQERHAGRVRISGAVKIALWRFRAKKRVLSSRQGEVHISKRQKI